MGVFLKHDPEIEKEDLIQIFYNDLIRIRNTFPPFAIISLRSFIPISSQSLARGIPTWLDIDGSKILAASYV